MKGLIHFIPVRAFPKVWPAAIVVTHIGIITQGKILFQGILPELLAKRQQSSLNIFATNDNQKAVRIFQENGIVARLAGSALAIPLPDKATIAALNRRLLENGPEVYQISTVNHDLEAIFFNVIEQR